MPYAILDHDKGDIKTLYLMEGQYQVLSIQSEENDTAELIRIPIEQLAGMGLKQLNLLIPKAVLPAPPPLLPVPERPKGPFSALSYEYTHFDQRDNDSLSIDRGSVAGNECGPTAMAMVAWACGFRGDGDRKQLEDEIAHDLRYPPYKMTQSGTVSHMAQYMRDKYGFEVKVDMSGTKQEMKKALDNGYLLVAHTGLTSSGHIVAVFGYDDAYYAGKGAFECGDPNGEFFAGQGYKHGSNKGDTTSDSLGDVYGDRAMYSYPYVEGGGFYWIHAIKHPDPKHWPKIRGHRPKKQ